MNSRALSQRRWPLKGSVPVPAGTYFVLYASSRTTAPLKIGDAEVSLGFGPAKGVLIAEKRKAFLAGGMVTLPSGWHVQFFREERGKRCQLLVYRPEGGLSEVISLIPKEI